MQGLGEMNTGVVNASYSSRLVAAARAERLAKEKPKRDHRCVCSPAIGNSLCLWLTEYQLLFISRGLFSEAGGNSCC